MSRPATFKQADVQRAIKAVQAQGLPVFETIISPDGAIRVLTAPVVKADVPADTYGGWKKPRGDRAA